MRKSYRRSNCRSKSILGDRNGPKLKGDSRPCFTLNDPRGMLVLPQLNNAAPQPLTAQLPLEMVRDKNLTEDALTLLSSKLPVVIDNADEVALKVVADVKLFINTPLPTVNTPPLLLKLIFAFTTRLSVMVSALVEFWVKSKTSTQLSECSEYAQIIPGCNKSGVVGHTIPNKVFAKWSLVDRYGLSGGSK